jgi:hypothetical protein
MGCYKVNAKKKLIERKIALIANEQINPSLYYVRIKGWVGGIAKYLLFLTGVDGVDSSLLRKRLDIATT